MPNFICTTCGTRYAESDQPPPACTICQDERQPVSFMYSYPNYIPLPASAVERIVKAVEPFEYDRVYGAFWDMVIERDGKEVVKRSADRYLRAIGR